MNKKFVKGAVFDMDGLLLDTEKLFLKFWIKASADYGYEMKEETVLEIRSLSRKYSVPYLKNLFGEEFPFNEVRTRRMELMNAYIEENGFEVKKGIYELLSYLKENNIRLAVATATSRDRAEKYLKDVNVFDFFDAVICGDMVTNGKPDPDIYITASKELRLEPCECVAFEDSPNGIKSAYKAGCQVIMIPDLTQPDNEILPLLSAVYEDLEKAIDFFKE